MFYPLKFKPVYKDYIWGGRGLEKIGKKLPDGIVAESWEVSCHPDGPSIVNNGRFEGVPLEKLIRQYPYEVLGNALEAKYFEKFPLLIKFIDANDNLSVQVHPDDDYAFKNENGEYGKNEMWYIIDAVPGAKLIYDVKQGVTRDIFEKAVRQKKIGECLKYIEVKPGDVINIPAGLVHAIGKGIMLAEVQQNSNTTYRVYDFDRVDKEGRPRPLHIEKALDVIDFNSWGRKEKYAGLKYMESDEVVKYMLAATKYFCVEKHDINGTVYEEADGSRFYIYSFIDGDGFIEGSFGKEKVSKGESVLIPSCMGKFNIFGNIKCIVSYMPDGLNIVDNLKNKGFNMADLSENMALGI